MYTGTLKIDGVVVATCTNVTIHPDKKYPYADESVVEVKSSNGFSVMEDIEIKITPESWAQFEKGLQSMAERRPHMFVQPQTFVGKKVEID